MTTGSLYKQGDSVTFWNGEEKLTGTVNGDYQALGENEHIYTHIPVYVALGDRCMIVNLANIVESP